MVPDLLALMGGPRAVEPVVADMVLPLDGHVPEHAGEKLGLGQGHGLLGVIMMITIAERHALRRGRDDAMILDGTAAQVAREVGCDAIAMTVGALDADIPRLARDRSQDLGPVLGCPGWRQVHFARGVRLIEPADPLATELGLEHPDREQVAVFERAPLLAIEPATGNQDMHMRMEAQGAPPGVQGTEQAHLRAEVPCIPEQLL